MQMAGDDARLVSGRGLRGQVPQHRHVDGRAGPHPLGVAAFAQQPVHSAHRELRDERDLALARALPPWFPRPDITAPPPPHEKKNRAVTGFYHEKEERITNVM